MCVKCCVRKWDIGYINHLKLQIQNVICRKPLLCIPASFAPSFEGTVSGKARDVAGSSTPRETLVTMHVLCHG